MTDIGQGSERRGADAGDPHRIDVVGDSPRSTKRSVPIPDIAHSIPFAQHRGNRSEASAAGGRSPYHAALSTKKAPAIGNGCPFQIKRPVNQ